ncbi:MAG: hypothetical protein U9N84_03490 [Actinomycetota bacterium]|nr:hypothetical protein [Actinomycetota bacterium]
MPFLISALVMITGLAWTLHLVVSPHPWAVDSALAIAIGTLIYSIVAMAALLLGRGRWTRYFAIGLVTAEMFIATVADFDGWLIAGLILGGFSLAGLGGPWFKGWLRERPAAGAPAIQPILLALGGFAMVPLVGLASPDGLQPAHGIAGAVGILLSWTYLKGSTWALWAFRFLMPLVAMAAALASPWGGAVLLIAAGTGLLYLAWLPVARLAVDPLPASLPAPKKRST